LGEWLATGALPKSEQVQQLQRPQLCHLTAVASVRMRRMKIASYLDEIPA